jgi:hypothetical protein
MGLRLRAKRADTAARGRATACILPREHGNRGFTSMRGLGFMLYPEGSPLQLPLHEPGVETEGWSAARVRNHAREDRSLLRPLHSQGKGKGQGRCRPLLYSRSANKSSAWFRWQWSCVLLLVAMGSGWNGRACCIPVRGPLRCSLRAGLALMPCIDGGGGQYQRLSTPQAGPAESCGHRKRSEALGGHPRFAAEARRVRTVALSESYAAAGLITRVLSWSSAKNGRHSMFEIMFEREITKITPKNASN